jgi:restriction system protein
MLLIRRRPHLRISNESPAITLKALLTFAGSTAEGALVEAVSLPWFKIVEMIRRDPNTMYAIDPRAWEELIAGAYSEDGFDEVILTPRSGDKGRDVIATKNGVGSIRIFDQVKAYKPGHVVTAEEVRAMIGVITGAQNVSKGVVTTTSDFAPRLRDDPYIKPLLPYRLELKSGTDLAGWLNTLTGPESEPSE